MKNSSLAMLHPLPALEPGETLNLDAWFKHLGEGRSVAGQGALIRAFKLCERLCLDKNHPTGEATIHHVYSVVNALVELNMDTDALVAAILHSPVENGELGLSEVESQFGPAVAKLIDGVNRMVFINELKSGSQDLLSPQEKNQQLEKLRKMILAMVEDVRVILIKLAERLHDMQQLKHLLPVQQRRVARETLDVYAPLANRLGIWQIKWQLEDMALRYLEPEVYHRIARLLDNRRTDRETHIQEMMTLVRDTLAEAGIQAELSGRPKHIYSIWEKMQRKEKPFHDLYDVLAVRIMVHTVTECYIALGLIHGRCPPVPDEFDDYIASPKLNNYRSLHTAVIGPDQQIFEVQIRTLEMHQQCELGVDSHWRYKEQSDADQHADKKIAWLRQVLTWKDEEGNTSDFVERFRSELFDERVYVLTPKGQVIELPLGATPLDFAYYIHTGLGHRARGARVNGHMVPLNYLLKTGDQVEIIKTQQERPSRHWLNPQLGYLKTPRALSRVKQWLKQQDTAQHLAHGRSLLNRELHRLDVQGLNLEDLATRFHFDSLDNFLSAIGRGDLNTAQVAEALTEQVLPLTEPAQPHQRGRVGGRSILIQGDDSIFTYPANCCKPVPDDAVVGYLTDRGVEVHREDCAIIASHRLEDNDTCLVSVEWGPPMGQLYPVDIHIKADDRFGLLRDVSSILTQEKINIIGVNTLTDADHIAHMTMRVEVRDVRQLSRALAEIDNLGNVMEVNRTAGKSAAIG